ncbi:Spo0E family sporulation regulatory protein-aspartic acid phosphatase [Effusibacillus lacus]
MQQINKGKKELLELFEMNPQLLREQLLKKSQELDRLIVQYYKKIRSNSREMRE